LNFGHSDFTVRTETGVTSVCHSLPFEVVSLAFEWLEILPKKLGKQDEIPLKRVIYKQESASLEVPLFSAILSRKTSK